MNSTMFLGHKPVTLTLIRCDRCSENCLVTCCVPNDARVHVELDKVTPVHVVDGPLFVRGVNSSFWKVRLSDIPGVPGTLFYIHEQYLRRG